MRLWLLLAASTLFPASGFAQGPATNAELERAKQSLEELKFAEAGKSLDAAWLAPGNDRGVVLEILKLQAIVAATLGQQDRARALFRTLLYLAPDLELPEGDLGPKVLSLYYEARGRVSVEGALRVEPGTISRDEQKVSQLAVKVTDSQKLAKAVRFHSRAAGRSWAEGVVPISEAQAQVKVGAPTVEWWAELLGDKDRVLARLGSAAQPIVSSRVATLVPSSAPPPEVAAAAPGPNLKPAAYVTAGAGALAAIGGLVFGIRANNQRTQIEGAARDADGKVIGITREKALAVNEQLKTSATVANTLYVASAVLIGTGVVLYLASPDLAVSASPAGVALAGSFP